MNATVKEWITKAEDDFEVAHLVLNAPLRPKYDAVIEFSVQELRFLTRVGAGFRYPGETGDKGDASLAIAICSRLRFQLLGLIDEAATENQG